MTLSTLQVGSFTFDWGSRTYVMGILNVTPDSFSGDGIIAKGDVVKAAVEQAREFILYGADILDVGGESTRPGSEPVNAEEEMERVIPVIEESEHPIIDFSGVRRLDFVSAGQLVNRLAPYKAAGREVIIRSPNHLVAELMAVVGLNKMARIIVPKS